MRKVLVEKNIPLDQGYRDFAQVCEIRNEEPSNSGRSRGIAEEQTQEMGYSDSGNETINIVQRWDRVSRPGGRSRGNKWGWGNRYRGQRLACFVCGNTEHLQRTCPSQYCQSCGKKGHNRRDCYSKIEVLSIDQRELRQLHRSNGEPGVMISIKLNNLENVVMLDSGAQPSIIDSETLSKLHIGYRVRPSRVQGVCAYL